MMAEILQPADQHLMQMLGADHRLVRPGEVRGEQHKRVHLLAAQAALADARAQHIAARASWFFALAQLARDTGTASPTLKAAVAVTSEPRTP